MLINDCITKLLNLPNVLVQKVDEFEKFFEINIETERSEVVCPCCKAKTSKIHDYRTQRIKDIPFQKKYVYIILRKRRYVCDICGKRFNEKYSFLPKYYHMTSKMYMSLIDDLRKNKSMKSIAEEHNVSSNTIVRAMDIVNCSPPSKLPDVLSIDEFKGNADGEKYQCILTNPLDKKVFDILPTRLKSDLIHYFSRFNGRKEVKYFVMDMWQPYKEIAYLFPNAQIVVDKFHYIRQVYWALENTRKRIQKGLKKDNRLSFKHCKKLLMAEFNTLSDATKNKVLDMLDINEDLNTVWQLKEIFIEVKAEKNPSEAKAKLRNWIELAQEAKIPELKPCVTAFKNWFNEILNSFRCPYTNGYTEGINNKIKVLKRNAYGFQNFARMKKRILHTCA